MSEPTLQTVFIEEASSLLEDLERYLLRLEEDTVEPAVADLLYRNVRSVRAAGFQLEHHQTLSLLTSAFESCLALIRERRMRVDAASMDLFLFTLDLLKKLVVQVGSQTEPSGDLREASLVCVSALDSLAGGETPATRSMPQVVSVSSEATPTEKKDLSGETEGVWVSNEKLDAFMKLSGELIVLKNYFQVLNQESELHGVSPRISGKVTDFSYSLNKITDTLQDQIMSIRKITLDRALNKLPRVVRQVSDETGKPTQLVTEGFELGVDRTIANALSSCMNHLIRNAIDHGIESADSRVSAGKSAEGRITIRAHELKGMVFLTVADDGGGINRQRVIAKALEQGLIDEARSERLTDEEAYDLLFLPGFSTAERVTGISGRGVGMDVVKSEIVNLKGRVRIESTRGQGTAFHIEVPVPKTVMVEQTVLVKSAETLIAVPLNAIAQLTTAGSLQRTWVGRQLTCQYQGRTVPLKTYRDLADGGISSEPMSEEALRLNPIVLLQHKNDIVGLLVDSIHDQLEAVIRPFDRVTQHFAGFKGTTVLGDDSIAYVIAPEEFVSLGLRKEAA